MKKQALLFAFALILGGVVAISTGALAPDPLAAAPGGGGGGAAAAVEAAETRSRITGISSSSIATTTASPSRPTRFECRIPRPVDMVEWRTVLAAHLG